MLDLNAREARKIGDKSVILKPAVLKNLLQILNTKEMDPSVDQIAQKVQIIKCLSSLLETVPTFLEILGKENLLSDLTDFLLDMSTTKQKTSTVVPVAWLEAKATNMRAHATEFVATLGRDLAMTVELLDNTQLLFH